MRLRLSPENTDELAQAYAQLVERAAQAGLLAPSGLTPREQSALLARSERLARDSDAQRASPVHFCS